jgi:hypothetical protein
MSLFVKTRLLVFVCCVCFLGFHNLFNLAAEEDAMTMIVHCAIGCCLHGQCEGGGGSEKDG